MASMTSFSLGCIIKNTMYKKAIEIMKNLSDDKRELFVEILYDLYNRGHVSATMGTPTFTKSDLRKELLKELKGKNEKNK